MNLPRFGPDDTLSPMPLLLRSASESDVPLIQDLARRIWHRCYADLLPVEQRDYMLAWMYAAHKLESEIRRGVDYRIAGVEGAPAGYLAWELLAGGETAHLHKLYLIPEWHGHGFGQAMLQHVMNAAVLRGARTLELRVNRGNARALRAYRRAGFEPAGERVTDIGAGFVMDDFILRRALRVMEPGFDCQSGTGDPRSG